MSLTKATNRMISGARVNVLDFGADPTGVADSTSAFNSAIEHLADSGNGGGDVYVPRGTYNVGDLKIARRNIMLIGDGTSYGYETTHRGGTIIRNTIGATYVIELGRNNSLPSTNNRAHNSGFKNIRFTANSTASEYGVIINEGVTLIDECMFYGFEYGCAVIGPGNSNRFINSAFVGNTKVGFCMLNAGESHCFPNYTPTVTVNSTTLSLDGCNFRQNTFGIVIRDGDGVAFRNGVVESNTQAGLYIHKPTGVTVSNIMFDNMWFENNYDGYTSGDSYSITGIDALKDSASTYITWSDTTHAGYQAVIDSETQDYGSGPSSYITFRNCKLNNAGSDQRSIKIDSVRWCRFDTCAFLGGDTANTVQLDSYSSYVSFWNSNGGETSALSELTGSNRCWLGRDGTDTYHDGGPLYLDSTVHADKFKIAGISYHVRLLGGAGSPEGSVASGVGSIYMRADGGTGTSMYVKESGGGNTGWVAK